MRRKQTINNFMTTKQKPLKAAKIPQSIDEIIGQNSFVPPPSLEQLTDEYVAKAKKKGFRGDGENDVCDTMGVIFKRLIEYYRNHVWSYENFLTLASPYDLDINEDRLREHWNGWLIMLQGQGRVIITPSDKSAYNFSTYQFTP